MKTLIAIKNTLAGLFYLALTLALLVCAIQVGVMIAVYVVSLFNDKF